MHIELPFLAMAKTQKCCRYLPFFFLWVAPNFEVKLLQIYSRFAQSIFSDGIHLILAMKQFTSSTENNF